MKPRTRRAIYLGSGLLALAAAGMLVLNAFQSNLVFYFGPSEVMANEAPASSRFRMGGVVGEGSIKRASASVEIYFDVTDGVESIPVTYSGFLPDMFREGKGVVVLGKMGSDGVFHADEVLAKHDENYMPPEAAESMEKAKRRQAAATVAMNPEGAQ
ncbi:MAG TPA: cytochrome c maturation protein CcmE [Burkholderiaceae bacterium]|nr:cytochrome c maturation protein CcmE [Burkholderiaceae bacterium]